MPNKLRDATTNIADTLSRGEPGVAVVRGLRTLGDRAVDTVKAGGEKLRQWATPAPPATDIELPNRRGRIDPRLTTKAPSTRDTLSKVVSGYKTVRKLGGSR